MVLVRGTCAYAVRGKRKEKKNQGYNPLAFSQGKGIADVLAALITGKVEGKQMTKTKTGKLAQMDSEHIALLKIIS